MSSNLFGAPRRANGGMMYPQKGYPRNPRGLPYELMVEPYRRGGVINVNKRMYGGANSEADRVFRSYENSHLRNHPNWNRFEADYANNLYGNPNFTADNVREMAMEYFHDALGDEKGDEKEAKDEKDEKEEKHTTQEEPTQDDNAPSTGGGDDEYEQWRREPPIARRGRVVKRSNGGLMTQDELAQYYSYFDKNFSRLPNYQDFLNALNNLNEKRKLTERSLNKLISKFFED